MLGIGRTGVQVESKFVGRQEETGFLMDQLQATREGRGGLVLVSGEAGIGKTRLVTELGKQAQDVGFLFLTGKCISQKDSDPYLPFLDALRSHTRHDDRVDDRMPIGLASIGSSHLESPSSSGEVLGMGFIPMADREPEERAQRT